MKRFISLLVVLAMLMSMVPAVFADASVTYTKITTMDELTDGNYVMVVDTGYAPYVFESGWLTAVQPTIVDGAVTDTADAVWTIDVTVDGETVTATLADSKGTYVGPKSGNSNGIQNAQYSWLVTCTDGAFTFAGQGSDTTTLASNSNASNGLNRFRSYKNTTVAGSYASDYHTEFTLYKETVSGCSHATENLKSDANGHWYVCACGEVASETEDHDGYDADYICDTCSYVVEPEANSTLTIAQANALALAVGTSYTANKYNVTGTVSGEVNADYGNLTIVDADGNSLYIYGLVDENDTLPKNGWTATLPVEGDVITVNTVLGTYSGSAQGKYATFTINEPEATLPSGTIEAVKGTTYTTDEWTAPSAGTLTVTLSSDNGLGYKVYINGEAQSLGWEGFCLSTEVEIAVAEGDVVYLEVAGKTTSWGNTDSTITWAYAFGDAGKSDYEFLKIITTADEHSLAMLDGTNMTVVEFCPTEAGVYTITATADIAKVGDTYVAILWADAEKVTSLEWTCTSVGQSVYIGFASDVALTIVKTGEASTEPAYETIVYENENTPVEFDESLYENITYVDVTDDVIDTAVLGEDGYYHLNTADGPILYVSFFGPGDTTLGGAWGYGQVKYVEYADGEIVSVTNYQDALGAYMMAVVSDGNYTFGNYYHPLTSDLITMLQNVGANNGWYGEEGWVGASEDAWMFACVTMDLIAPDYTDLLVGESNTVTLKDGDVAYYTWTATEAGYLTWLFELSEEVWPCMEVYINGVQQETIEWLFVELAVAAGDEVKLHLSLTGLTEAYELTFVPEFLASAEGGDEGGEEGGDDTTESAPLVDSDVSVEAGECITIIFTPETNGTLTGTISAVDTGWEFQIADADAFYQSTVWSDSTPNTISESLTGGTTYTIKIYGYDEATWEYLAATITYELTWTPASSGDEEQEVTGSGTDEDPYSLLVNANNSGSVVGYPDDWACDGVWYTWTATADGTLTLTFDEADPIPYVVIYLNGIQYKAYESDGASYVASVNLTAGDVIYILVETWEFVDADYTFYASFGGETEEEEALPLYDGDNELVIWAGEGTTPYTYTATQSGTLYLTFTAFAYSNSWGYRDCSDYISDYFGYNAEWEEANWMALTINGEMVDTYYGCVEVAEGDVISIGWVYYGASNYVQSNYDMFATLNLNYEGYDLPEPGSIDAPYDMYMMQVDYGMGTTVEVASGSSVFYNLIEFAGSTVTITGEGDFQVKVCSYEYDENWNEIQVWTTYTAENGVVEFYAEGYQILVEIVNNSDAAATYEVGYYYPLGHIYNPEVIVGEGSWTASVDANSNGYYYQWTADKDMTLNGLMTITVFGSDGSWMYYVSNYGQYIDGDYHYSSQDGTATEVWTVFEGDYFSIMVNTDHIDVENYDYDTPAGDITITITFEEKELVQGVDYAFPLYADETPVDVTVAGDSKVWYELYDFSSYYGDYYFTVTGEGAYVEYNGVTYTDEDGDGIISVQIADNPADVYVGNSGDAEATFTLGCVIPVGNQSNPHIIIENGEYSTSEFAEGSTSQYYFQFTAPAAGTITVEVLNDTYWNINLWNKTTYASEGGNYRYADSNTFTMDVAAGDVISIYGRTYSYDTYSNVAGVLSFNFTFEELTAEPGSAENPYSVHFADCYETPVETVEIPAGETVYYALKGFYGNIALVAGEGAYIVYNGVTYTDDDGDGVIELVADDTTMLVEIGNSGTEAAVFTVGGEFPLGTSNNPEQIGEGQTAVEIVDNFYYLTFTAECDGVVTFTISGDDWMFMIADPSGMIYDAASGEWSYMGGWVYRTGDEPAVVVANVLKGETYMLCVSTYFDMNDLYATFNPGTVYVDVTTEYDHVDDDADGYCDICGTEMPTESEGLLGDVNGDGSVNLADVTLLMQYAMKEIDADALNLDVADVNSDGSVNLADVTVLMQYVMKVITEFPSN